MIQEGILHRIDSEYAYPLDKETLVVRLRVSKRDNFKSVECLFNPAMRLIKTQQVVKMEIKYSDFDFNYYEARLHNKFPSFSYLFKIVDADNKVYFISDEGITNNYDFALSQVSAFRYAFINDDDLFKVNKKIEGRIFYQIFVDSFANGGYGDKNHITRSWDSNDLEAFKDKKYHPVFLGGDLKGVLNKLDYLKDLGIGAVYLTPIFKAMTNHKYDTIDYFQIDNMFGDVELLKELVEEAHKRDILIFLDLVFNHTSYFHPFFQDVISKGKASPYYDFYMIDGDKPDLKLRNYMTFSEGWLMPKLNGNNPKVRKYCSDVALYYLEKCNVDGYRLDVSNELPHSFWMEFKSRLKEKKEDIFLIGECWYNAYSFLSPYEWDSTMNYAFSFSAKEYFADRTLSTQNFVNKLNLELVRYREQTNRTLINLLDSHDVSRFYEYVKPNKDLYLLSELFLISFIGCPMVYYGDEIFMEGGNDPFNRRGMEWNSKVFNSQEFELIKKIYALRKLNAFKEGEMKLSSFNELLLIERSKDNETFTIVINNSNEAKDFVPNGEVILSNEFENNHLLPFGFAVVKIS